jgi:hypothetical protein
VAASVLVAVAILGFLVGQRRSSATSLSVEGKIGIASAANVVLEYPAPWKPAAGRSPIAELGLTQGLLLAPEPEARQAGLAVGSLPLGDGSPIPSRLLARLKVLPHAEVVGLPAGQAYRYDLPDLPGYGGSVQLFLIPGEANAGDTALACYAEVGFAAEQQQCARIVARLSLSGEAQLDLTPDTGYAHKLAAIVGGLNRERLALRAELAHTTSRGSVASVASALGSRFAFEASAVAGLEPPDAAADAQQALESSLQVAGEVYEALGRAAQADDSVAYTALSRHLKAAESGVDSALEGFALLGYEQS